MDPSPAMMVPGTPEDVRRRLDHTLLRVGHLWFPTRAELHAWHDRDARLYVRWTSPTTFEIGRRMPTMPAARLMPALRGRLTATDAHTTALSYRVRMPRFTEVVLAVWAVTLVGWAVALVVGWVGGTAHPGWAIAWGALAAGTLGGGWLGWRTGRDALLAELDALAEAAATEVDMPREALLDTEE